MGATSVTRSYTSVIATTLDKVRDQIEDQISTGSKFLYFIRRSGNWKSVSSLGDRYRVPLMYELANADSYSSFGQIDTTPPDGVTAAFYEWRQAAAPISVSGLEEAQTRGSEAIQDILKTRTKQAIVGLEELFNTGIMQGHASVDGSSIATARVSPINGSSFVDPIGLLVKASTSTSTTIGAINQSTNTWWKNQSTDDDSSTYAGFLKNLRKMYIDCSKGGGGSKAAPDFHVCDPATFALYESSLAAAHQNPSYQKGDVAFETVQFKGSPVVWEEKVCDVKNSDVTPAGSDAGTWYMLNSNFLGVAFDREHNFTAGEMVKPENADAKVSLVLWYGCTWTSNRRKNGVLYGITTTTAS